MTDIFNSDTANKRYDSFRWKRSAKVGKLRIYVTWNWRLKTRNKRDDVHIHMSEHKKKVYKREDGRCEICGKHLEYSEMELHHVLPLATFKSMATNKANMMCLCAHCHKGVHANIYRQLAMMEAKAADFGIDLKAYYGV